MQWWTSLVNAFPPQKQLGDMTSLSLVRPDAQRHSCEGDGIISNLP